MDNKLYDRCMELYEQDLRLVNNPVCAACDVKKKHPLAIWHIGDTFAQSDRRILFIGKPHRGDPGKLRQSGVLDPREHIQGGLKDKPWPYWSYTRIIADLVHGSGRGWERIAFTNIVKCTNVHGQKTTDATSKLMFDRCALELQVVTNEIRILRPTHIVLYTGSFFRNEVQKLSLGAADSWRDVNRGCRPCGKKSLFWHEREAMAEWGAPIRSLITGHPERMLRPEYTRLIADWVLSSGVLGK